MKKFYATLLFALVAMVSSAQVQNDTVYVMVDFNANPWNYLAPDVTSGWSPSLKYDNDFEGLIWSERSFAWPLAAGSDQKVDIIVYPGDPDEYKSGPAFATYDFDEAEAAGFLEKPGKRALLYTASGTTMRFKAPAGYKFGKMLFYTFRNSNFLVGSEYEEYYKYTYNDEDRESTLKCWTPASPKRNAYDYDSWEGDETNILFNYPYFSAHFVKIDIRLVPDGVSSVKSQMAGAQQQPAALYDLQGRRLQTAPRRGVYVDGAKKFVK